MQDSLSFESKMLRLEEVVKTLERGDVPLENALALFEEGTALVRQCGTLLDTAEQKVVRLMKGADGEPIESDFASDE